MPVVFGNFRLTLYGQSPSPIIAARDVSLTGCLGGLASVFLPNIHHDFTIFSLIVPSITIFVFLLLWQWSQPRIELPIVFILFSLWLAMGAWAADIIGHVECFSLRGQQTQTKNGSMSSSAYCYEMKVIEAFSWMAFVITILYFVVLWTLANRAQALGRRYVWIEDIRELPWFGEYPGYQQFQMTQQGYYNGGNGGYVVHQQPGHSVVIQHGQNGAAPTISQVPGMVSTAGV
ncbi:hypothetical protein PLICRDRAFT_34035 [Plicaturopsis crispa FD-325 SS-3]|nr:hypothetical protein PLICRDRAFT_34035 [Plicaturopsis crispa FD-325 SS-3]